jgi:serine/threonine-protein phosphatase 2A regulatory subunit B'
MSTRGQGRRIVTPMKCPPPRNPKTSHKAHLAPLQSPSSRQLPAADELPQDVTVVFSTHHSQASDELSIQGTKAFSEIPPKDCRNIFVHKCKECSKICDWSVVIKDQPAKKTKSELLCHFMEAFETPSILRFVVPGSIAKFIDMIVDNLARPFPSMLKITAFDYGDQMEDLAWPHLQLVYRATFFLFESHIQITIQNRNFLSVLVSNSCSPDSRERQGCRDVLTRVYRKCEGSRAQIARFVHNQFLTLICSRELLDFYVLIVDNMGLPLSVDNIRVFHECVLVLHSSHLFLRFCLSLLQVLNHYIRVDSTLLKPAFIYIFEHWPWATVKKQVIFLSEVEGLVVSYGAMIDGEIAELIFKQLAKLVTLPNIEIADCAINMIIGDSLGQVIVDNCESSIKMLLSPLYSAAKSNWNELVRDDAEFAVKMFHQLDPELFRQEAAAIKNAKQTKKAYQQMCKTRWEKVFEAARARDKSIKGINMSVFL